MSHTVGSLPTGSLTVGMPLILAILTAVSALAALILVGPRAAVGVILGGGLALLNYLWLRRVTQRIFDPDYLGSTSVLAVKYILRYFALGTVLFLVYLTGVVPVTAVIVGLAGFAAAALIQGFRRSGI